MCSVCKTSRHHSAFPLPPRDDIAETISFFTTGKDEERRHSAVHYMGVRPTLQQLPVSHMSLGVLQGPKT